MKEDTGRMMKQENVKLTRQIWGKKTQIETLQM